MNGPFLISSMSHICLQVVDLEAAIDSAMSVMGMQVVEEDGNQVWLSCDGNHQTLCYVAGESDGVEHIGLVASGPDALEELRARLKRLGVSPIREEPSARHFEDAIAFVAPDGFTYEVGVGTARPEPQVRRLGAPLTHFGHVNLHVPDVDACAAFFRETLDFRISDVISGRGVFLRCNSEHHAMAFLEGRGVLHHHAWAAPSIRDLGQVGDLLDERGSTLLWGPIRHGAGDNVAVYFAEPSGAVVEVYAEMQHILDESGFTHRVWENSDERWWSRWTKIRLSNFHSFGVRPAPRSSAGDR
jgi:catechol 2,3-dioxygenase